MESKKRRIKDERNKLRRRKRQLIITLCICLAVIAGVFVATIKYEKDNNQTSTEAEAKSQEGSEDISSNKEEETKPKTTNKYGYLPLEEDKNAEDAMQVMDVTQKLAKAEIKYPVRTDGKKVAYLTFDDGPSTTNTPKVLEILKKNDIKATFFVLGYRLDEKEQAKELLRQTAKEGHAIANHTYSHDYDILYPVSSATGKRTINPQNFMNDINKCNASLKATLGDDFNTRVIRFPGGYWSWQGRTEIKPVLDEKGIAFINWDCLNEDAEGKANKTAAELIEISRKNLDKLGPNADSVVFLMHDTYAKEETAKALQGIIDLFKERGFEFKSIK
ncbi:MAG: polysaccharide deacetylase [Clostridium sp.]|nr:polysaccharide deacetylase [Clostridium sp.]